MRIFLLLFFSLGFYTSALSQVDKVGSGRAISFDGVDDRIDISKSYTSLNLPFSVSAWIFIDYTLNASTPIFVSNDNNPTYRGFWFLVSPTGVLCEFGDGAGASNPAFRRGKGATINSITGRWVNVCVVMVAPFDIKIYVNGVDVGGFSTGGSNLGMKSPEPGDVAKIDYFLSNNVVYRGKSMIDEVRLWNKALTELEVRRDMCRKLTGSESGLVGFPTN